MQTPEQTGSAPRKSPLLFRLIRATVNRLFPKFTVYGAENLPPEPVIIVGNHAQVYGPLAGELRMPRPCRIWCVGEMMNRKEVPAYAFQDFWSAKPRRTLWFWRLASHAIAPLAAYVLSNAHTIPVYHDARVMTTFRRSVETLQAGEDIVIFPESAEPYNGIVTQFHRHFADLAKLYFRRTGKAVCFVPLYVAPKLKGLYFGPPVRYNPEAPDAEELERICAAMMDGITDLAVSLPPHTVVPYLNIPKSQYPLSTNGKQRVSPPQGNAEAPSRVE